MSRASGFPSSGDSSAAGALALGRAAAGRPVGRVLAPPRIQAWPMAALAAAFVLSCALKVTNVGIGGPQFMIDDFTLYEGGFLVWFGQAPPQHAYLESWLCGLVSLAVFGVQTILSGGWAAAREDYFVASALRDFYNAPDAYYAAYRSVLIGVDLVTACVVFRVARQVLEQRVAAVWVAMLFLFTYNTLWSALVGRPDTLLTCAATVGVYLYLKGTHAGSQSAFWWSAICFGLAAGLKMHGALFTIFAAVDLLRINGVRRGWRVSAGFAAVAFFFFLVADGSLLFDPLKYVKARAATYYDDLSPYIKWGDQFAVMLRGSGWIVMPVAAAGACFALWRRGVNTTRLQLAPASPAIQSLAVFALGWLVIFSTTRQLRGYWMLPALPLFYMLAAWHVARWRRPALQAAFMSAACVLMLGQTIVLSARLQRTNLDELRAWVIANVAPGEQFYMLGDSVLRLPRSTEAMRVYRTAYEREIASDIQSGRPFVERQLKNWEELATLRLFDMLGYRNGGGYSFFNYRDVPPDKFSDLISLGRMDYLIVQQQFALSSVPGLEQTLADSFSLVGERRSEGGDGSGLSHRIYRRVQP